MIAGLCLPGLLDGGPAVASMDGRILELGADIPSVLAATTAPAVAVDADPEELSGAAVDDGVVVPVYTVPWTAAAASGGGWKAA